MEKAQELFVLAKQAGVDAVKLQKRDDRRLSPARSTTAPTTATTLRPDVRRHREALEPIAAPLSSCRRAPAAGLVFFATAFDERARPARELDVPACDRVQRPPRAPLLRNLAAIGKPLIVSTGGATIEDVDRAVET